MGITILENSNLPAVLRGSEPRSLALACWLGQAGFLLQLGDSRLAVDPYLSDSLAKKYGGTRFPHRRMMPPPIAPGDLTTLDAVLCTHAHTDHMDPETLVPLARANPHCCFIVPRSAAATALERGVPAGRMVAVDAGENGTLSGGVRWYALPSAHEQVETDARGLHRYLGYILEIDDLRIYHSGDCAPYPELAHHLRRHSVDMAILPVNGRDAQRSAAGIAGDFTFDEAVELCREAGIAALLPCHFGMFDFNTVDEAWLDDRIATTSNPPQCVRPRIGQAYQWRDSLCHARTAPTAPAHRQSQEAHL
jgi:L-ascorbate metabolism protein UlaG (beta-lactamase superfamily)